MLFQMDVNSCHLHNFLFFLSDYLIPYEGSSMRYIDQYYPYHSVFDPIIEYKRLNYF